jgi:hypothetical protein
MKKIFASFLSFLLISSPLFLHADHEDSIQELGDQTDALYRVGAGAQDGAYTSLATSMLGWGLGLAAAIAIIAAVLHQSKAGHGHNPCKVCH